MNSTAIQLKRCLNHSIREAVARCPDCQEFFCRECVVEHEEKVLCAGCLQKRAAQPRRSLFGMGLLLKPLAAFGSLAIGWLFFYWAGQILLSIPSNFHEGTLWSR